MSITDYSDENGDRALRLRRTLVQILQRRKCGEDIPDRMVIALYPELMPELGDDLQILSDLDKPESEALGALVAGHQVASGALSVRCPDCCQPNPLSGDTPLTNIICSSCGSKFSLLEDTESPNLAGKRLGHFELIEQMGAGSFGVVWKAKDTELDRTVAVKIPRGGQLSSTETERFIREARSAAQLNHRNIVRVYEVGREGETVFIVSELVTGMTLAELPTDRRPTFHEAARLSAEIADALQHAHESGVIHRDLKPQNVMLDRARVPHVMDFGLAKRDTGEVTATVDGRVLGTPAYMSPEQAQGKARHADRRSDVYSLGVILFELLTGELPFRGNSRMLIHQVVHDEAPSPRKLNGSVPKDLETICLKCLEKEPNKRYDAAKDVSEELHRFLRDEPIQARPASSTYRAWRLCKRNPVLTILSGLLATVLLMLAVAGPAIAIKQVNLRHDAEEAHKQSATRADELARRVYLIHIANADKALVEGHYLHAQVELSACPNEQRGWEWEYLTKQIRATIVAFSASEQPIFTRDGERLVAIGHLGTAEQHAVNTWDLASGKLLSTLKHGSPLYSVAMAPNEKRIACGDSYGNVIVWDTESRKRLWFVRLHKERLDGLAFSPDGRVIASASFDRRITVVDANNGQEQFPALGPFRSHTRKVVFSANGHWLASGFSRGEEPAILINAETGDIVATFPDGDIIPTFDPSGQRIATANVDGWVKVWNWDGKELDEIGRWHAADRLIRDINFNADGTRLASTDMGNATKVWDVTTEERVATLKSEDTVQWLAFSPSGEKIGLFSLKDGIRIWQYRGREHGLTVKPLHGAAEVMFSPDGRLVLAASPMPVHALFSRHQPESVAILEAQTGAEICTIDGALYAASWSPDGREIIASSASEDALRTYEVATGEQLRAFSGLSQFVMARVGASNQRLVSISSDGMMRVLDSKSGKETLRRNIAQEKSTGNPRGSLIVGMGFGQDGNRIGVGFLDFSVEVWDTRYATLVSSHLEPGQFARRFAFSNDGNRVYVGSEGGQLTEFDIVSGHETQRFVGHVGRVHAIAIAPDEDQIVSGDFSGRVIIWDVASGQRLVTLTDGDHSITSLDWSSDGRRIVAGKEEGTVQIWTLPRSR